MYIFFTQIEYSATRGQINFLRAYSRQATQNITYHCRNSKARINNKSLKLRGDNELDMEFHSKSLAQYRPIIFKDECKVSKITKTLFWSARMMRECSLDNSFVSLGDTCKTSLKITY